MALAVGIGKHQSTVGWNLELMLAPANRPEFKKKDLEVLLISIIPIIKDATRNKDATGSSWPYYS